MTPTTTMIDLAHPVHVLCDDRPGGLGHRAACGCGWAGDWQDDQADAEVDALDHREVAVGPGDGLDAVMGELLDLQDDLAAVVVWLAENWSADLPVPTVCGSGGPGERFGPAGVELRIYCLDGAELARIAHLMSVPTRDDETPDSYGNRYRRARRVFGRVALGAFTDLGNVETAP